MKISRIIRAHCKHWTLKKWAIIVSMVYVVITCISTVIILNKLAYNKTQKTPKKIYKLPDLTEEDARWNPWGEDFAPEEVNITSANKKRQLSWDSNRSLDFGKHLNAKQEQGYDMKASNIEIWSKSDIGLYFWWHIFDGGKLEKKMGGIWYYGFKKFGNYKFKFRSGSGVIPSKAPSDVENLVLVLSADTKEHVEFANIWLKHIANLPFLRNVALILLGNGNTGSTVDWLLTHIRSARRMSSAVKAVYLVRDVFDGRTVVNVTGRPATNMSSISNLFFPWPLGIDISRQFPKIRLKHIDAEESRSYECSVVLTGYHNVTTYRHITHILTHHHSPTSSHPPCMIWSNVSSSAPGAVMRAGVGLGQLDVGLSEYVGILLDSDLFICPPARGQHAETHQIYEALSAGAVPVIVRPDGSGRLNATSSSPAALPGTLSILSHFNAPLIYLTSWHHLPNVLDREANYTVADKVKRRVNVLTWYHKFKRALREQMLDLMAERFFNKRRWTLKPG